MIHFEVAVAVPIYHTLTYYPPKKDPELKLDETTSSNFLGRRVLVALGKRMVTGYVVALSKERQKTTEFTIRPIVKFLDQYPLFHYELVPFFHWVASYYQYPIGLVIKAALPGGLAPKSSVQLVVHDSELLAAKVPAKTWPNWLEKLVQKGAVDYKKAQVNFTKSDISLLQKLITSGGIAKKVVTGEDSLREKTENCLALVDKRFPQPERVSDDYIFEELEPYRQRVSTYCACKIKISETKALTATFSAFNKVGSDSVSIKEIKGLYQGAPKALEKFIDSGVFARVKRRVYRNPLGQQLHHYPRPVSLTLQQKRVLGEIEVKISDRVFAPFLLHGVTGCGKTEVYLQAAELTLKQGRGVIILVPEIALATQLEAHFVSRFKELVVLLHSGLSPREKYDQYLLALRGKARVVIGARSAVFAPLKDPGLIIVDEEHDSSYKQDDSFRYHGRDLAVARGNHHNSVVILGSATPSITSFNNANNGKYTLLTMSKRVGRACLPSVQLVDLSKNQKVKEQKSSIIGQVLFKKLELTLESGRQAVLLHNRRGFSNALICKDCGNPVQCNHCNISLTLHKGKNRLICHYCGYTTHAETICVHCRSTELAPVGFGTEKVEEELRTLLPDARIQRIDSDTAADKKKFISILQAMHRRELDILIGTQMIAKGHHFPNVTLVGVVWADGGMSMPDYKAAERTFQLITQVNGRAGRGEIPGEVVIQTLRPDHYAIQYAKNHQYLEFFRHEMELRKNPIFPPYVRLVLLRVRGKVEKQVQQSASQLTRFCRRAITKKKYAIEVLGPAPSPLDKVKDNFRWQVLLKGKSTTELHDLCGLMRQVQKELLVSQCSLTIDVDPENMM